MAEGKEVFEQFVHTLNRKRENGGWQLECRGDILYTISTAR
jgi:hypothetical protein